MFSALLHVMQQYMQRSTVPQPRWCLNQRILMILWILFSVESAIMVYEQLVSLLGNSVMTPHKWVTNGREVMEKISCESIAKVIKLNEEESGIGSLLENRREYLRFHRQHWDKCQRKFCTEESSQQNGWRKHHLHHTLYVNTRLFKLEQGPYKPYLETQT